MQLKKNGGGRKFLVALKGRTRMAKRNQGWRFLEPPFWGKGGADSVFFKGGGTKVTKEIGQAG